MSASFNGRNCLVVIGGSNALVKLSLKYSLKTVHNEVEVMDLSSGKGWILGPDLPQRITKFTMVTSPTGSLIVLGGYAINADGHKTSRLILELSGDSLESLKWTVLDQKLHFKREAHASITMHMDSYNAFMENLKLEKISVYKINQTVNCENKRKRSNNQSSNKGNKRTQTQDKKTCWYRYNCRKNDCTCTVPFGNRSTKHASNSPY